jgi:hypothetical protein
MTILLNIRMIMIAERIVYWIRFFENKVDCLPFDQGGYASKVMPQKLREIVSIDAVGRV